MKRLTNLAVLVVLVAGASSLSAQNLAEADRVVAEQAAEWLGLVDSDAYVESWERTSPMFREQVTAEQWEEAGRQVRSQTGQLVGRELREVTATAPPGLPAGEYRVVLFGSEYANLDPATESVILRQEAEDDWRVIGYFVQPG